VSLTAGDAARLEECLAGEGVAVIPTDTVYGVACSPDSAVAVRRIYELKRRPPVKPAAVMFFALDAALDALPELGPRTRAALAALLPGPATLLLENPKRRFPLACDPAGAHADDTSGSRAAPLGVRVPLLKGPLAALASVRIPVLQSSANLSGQAPPRRLTDVPGEIREGADLVLDGGELAGTASTVIDLSEYEQGGRWRIVREGPLARAALERVLG
jgi:L-threonylcarbamoyladenylate synthase